MSNLALDLLIEADLISSSGKQADLSKISKAEASLRLSNYVSNRIATIESPIETDNGASWLNALFSTSSVKITYSKLLSSALVYNSIIIDDPLVPSGSGISLADLQDGLDFYSWAYELIRAGYIKTIPITHLNRPSNQIPFLASDDAFKSSIPEQIHDFIHENAILKSVVQDEKGRMLVLNESAYKNRRTALHVGFKDDNWYSGATLYLFQNLENGKITWEKDRVLDKEKFSHWAYQAVNQAMRARLIDIYNESHLASSTGHTYITESDFEAKFMAMSEKKNHSSEPVSARFLQANNSFLAIDSPNTILNLRSRHRSTFEKFNTTLRQMTEELSTADPAEFEKKADFLFRKEIMPQIDEIRVNVNAISGSFIKGTMVGLSGLAAAIVTGSSVPLIPALILSTATGLTEALPEISKQQRLKHRPAYIWHKIVKDDSPLP